MQELLGLRKHLELELRQDYDMTNLHEGLEKNDLARMVHTEMHIDEFKSKLGRDEDVAVISFKVRGKEPGNDLVNFIEKGYSWVIDADVSSGEMDDGDYIVFVEGERNTDLAKNIMSMMQDIMNLTGQKLADWRVRYRTDTKDHDLTEYSLQRLVPSTAKEYQRRFGDEDLENMKAAAQLKTDKKAPKNDYTESLRRIAGLI
jgi:hypothetical protein